MIILHGAALLIRAPQAFTQRLDGDTLSQDETKANETKQLNLPQADSVVYQVHRLMSPIPEKLFSQSGILRKTGKPSPTMGESREPRGELPNSFCDWFDVNGSGPFGERPLPEFEPS